MENQVIETLNQCLTSGQPVALITVISSSGTSPARPGAIMLVRDNSNTIGTIGGGDLEFQAISKAGKCLAANTSREMRYALDKTSPAMTTAEVHLFIKVFSPQTNLLLVGAGHVNQELHRQAGLLGFRVTVLDDRQELLTQERFPGAECIYAEDIPAKLSALTVTEKTFIAVATRSHDSDRLALAAAAATGAAYVGMIGSSKKIKTTFAYLREQGIAEEKIAALYAPMGLNIASTRPREIAVAIISEMLLVKNGGSAEHMRTVKKITP